MSIDVQKLQSLTLDQVARIIDKEIFLEKNQDKFAYAMPYLDAMKTLNNLNEDYLFDSGREVVLRFLCNVTTWRGENARILKAELNRRLDEHKRTLAR